MVRMPLRNWKTLHTSLSMVRSTPELCGCSMGPPPKETMIIDQLQRRAAWIVDNDYGWKDQTDKRGDKTVNYLLRDCESHKCSLWRHNYTSTGKNHHMSSTQYI